MRLKKLFVSVAILVSLSGAMGTSIASASTVEVNKDPVSNTLNKNNYDEKVTQDIQGNLAVSSVNYSIISAIRSDATLHDLSEITYYISPGLSSGLQSDIKDAMQDWANAVGASFYRVPSSQEAQLNFQNTDAKTIDGDLNAVTTTTIHSNSQGRYIEKADIKVDHDRVLLNSYSLQGKRIFEHEIGHGLGLSDQKINPTGSIMYYRTPQTGITTNDIKAIQDMYGEY